MKKNIGKKDRIGRLALAVILLGLYGLGVVEGSLGMTAVAISIIMIVTASLSFCPLYTFVGMKICDKDGACCGGGRCSSDKKDEEKAD